jgi:hypothetical protein
MICHESIDTRDGHSKPNLDHDAFTGYFPAHQFTHASSFLDSAFHVVNEAVLEKTKYVEQGGFPRSVRTDKNAKAGGFSQLEKSGLALGRPSEAFSLMLGISSGWLK